MKRFFLTAFAIFISFLLQTTVFQKLALADVVPNFLLIVTVAFGYMRGEKEGMYTGFLSGLLVDCIFGDIVGLYALLYLIIGYLNGFCRKIYYSDHIIIPVILVALSDFIYNFFYYVFEFLFRSRLDFIFYIRRIIIPEMVYTVLAAILFYKLLQAMNTALEHSHT